MGKETDIKNKEKVIEFLDPLESIIDEDWAKTAFIVDVKDIHEEAQANIFSNYADHYFLSSAIGGSMSINPQYQFTRYADIPRKGRTAEAEDFGPALRNHNIGMGRYFAEAIESNQETLILEFGIPEFQSIFSFFTRAVDYNKSVIANEGRSTKMYELGEKIGYAAQLIAFNVGTVFIYAGIGLYKTLHGNGDPRYYHMKPNMPSYWASVNSIMTFLATERGILVPQLTEGKKDRLGMPIKVSSEDMNALHELYPEIFKEGNYIDVFAIAQRPQVIINNQLLTEMKYFKEGRITKDQVISALNSTTGKLKENPSYEKFLKELKTVGKGKMFTKDKLEDQNLPEMESSAEDPKEYLEPDDLWTYLKMPIEKAATYIDDIKDYTYATVRNGGKNVVLTVEHVGSLSDSFSNSAKDIPAKDKLNSLGGAARDIRFSLSGGNILGKTVQGITDGVKDVAMGTLDTLTFGLSNVMAALMGGGFINFPKMWADSSTTLAKTSYKIVATPPYGNIISQAMDMDLVVSVILAGMLPQSIGQGGYTSPFLCKAFMRGKQNIDFGMITECSITRGINNVPYNKDGRTLGLEITFTVSDFSEIMAASTKHDILGAWDISMDETNPLNKYLTTLAGRDYHTSRYVGKTALLNASRAILGASALTSPAHLSMMAGTSLFGRISSIAYLDASSIYLRDKN